MKFKFLERKPSRVNLCFYLVSLFLVCANASIAQNNLQRYYNNIVAVDNDFGFIIGEDAIKQNRYYFLVATLNDTPSDHLDYVYLYQDITARSAKLIRRFNFDQAHVDLYSIDATKRIDIQRLSYSGISGINQQLGSYMNDAKSDGVWFSNNTSYTIFGRSEQNYLGRVPTGEYFERGMPLVDSNGSVVGLIATQQAKQFATDVVFVAVDMKAIAEVLYGSSACDYFKLVESGYSETRCALADLEKAEREAEEKNIRRDNKTYAIAMGPSFNGHFAFTGGAGGYGFSAGWSFYIRPDVGRFRAALKPRYSYTRFNLEDPIDLTINDIKIYGYRHQVFEMPIMLEWVTKRDKSSNSFFGIGYSPGYQLPLAVQYSSDSQTDRTKLRVDEASVITTAFAVELGLEIDNVRILIFALYQSTPISGSVEYIFMEDVALLAFGPETDGSLKLGVDIEFRLRGKWGLKGKR